MSHSIICSFLGISSFHNSSCGMPIRVNLRSCLRKKEPWEIIKDFFKKRDNRGATPTHDRRGIVNGIFYVIKTGCQWRMMPKEFAPWETIYSCYQDWNSNGVWDEENMLRIAMLRLTLKKCV